MSREAAFDLLSKTQQLIAGKNQEFLEDLLLFAPVGQRFHVEFNGLAHGDGLQDFFDVLCSPPVAETLFSLALRGPDEGGNGTRNWDLTPLLENSVLFPHLTSIFIEPTLPDHHNQTIIARYYEEEGQIGRLASKAPSLQSLTVPSAPDASFFQTELSQLQFLRVDSGYDTENFILNLSDTSNFPLLRTLDFGDYNQRKLENYPNGDDYSNGCTPFEHYRLLFDSQAFSSITRFVLRNSILSVEELAELHSMKKKLQFLVIQSPMGHYI